MEQRDTVIIHEKGGKRKQAGSSGKNGGSRRVKAEVKGEEKRCNFSNRVIYNHTKGKVN
jgi:hypothetical protein